MGVAPQRENQSGGQRDVYRKVAVEKVLERPGFLRTPLRPQLVYACLFFIPPLAAVLGIIAWFDLTSPGYFGPWWAAWGLAAFGIALGAGVVWFAAAAVTTFGVDTDDSGIVVFDRTAKRGFVLKRIISWHSLRNPRRLSFHRISIDGDPYGVVLSPDQARAVFRDPRCPLGDHLPENGRRAISPT